MTSSEHVPGFVAKSEVENIPVAGWISHFWRCLYVERVTKPGKKSVTEQIQERAARTGRIFILTTNHIIYEISLLKNIF